MHIVGLRKVPHFYTIIFCQKKKNWPIISTVVFTQINLIFSYIRKRRNDLWNFLKYIICIYMLRIKSKKHCSGSSIRFQIGKKKFKLPLQNNTLNMIWNHRISLIAQRGFDYTGPKFWQNVCLTSPEPNKVAVGWNIHISTSGDTKSLLNTFHQKWK